MTPAVRILSVFAALVATATLTVASSTPPVLKAQAAAQTAVRLA